MLERLFERANKNIYVGMSSLVVWITTVMYHLHMEEMMRSQDGVRALVGAFGQWFVGFMMVLSIVQLVILLGGMFFKDNKTLLMVCLVLEILYFLVMQFWAIFIHSTSAVLGGLTLVIIVIFEVANILGIICMVREVRNKDNY